MILAIVVVMMFGTTPVIGQEQPSDKLSDAQASVAPGDVVRVIDSRGEVVQGKILRLTPTVLQVKAGSQTREWKESDLREVRKRKNDSAWSGGLIGLAAGLGAGALIASSSCGNDSECLVYADLAFIPIGAGAGLAAGLIIDSAIHRFDTIYRAPQPLTRSLRWTPVLSKDRKGVAVAFRF